MSLEPRLATLAAEFDARARTYALGPELADGDTRHRLLEHLDPVMDETLLDVGCGPGATARAAGPFVGRVIALDLSHAMLGALALESRRAGRLVPPRVRGDACSLPFRDGAVQLVACRHAARHFGGLSTFLAEASRVLARGGRLAIVDAALTGEPEADAVLAELEALRGPGTPVLRSEPQWRQALAATAGLRVEWVESPHFDREAGRSLLAWCAEAGLASAVFERAKARLLGTSPDVRRALGVLAHGSDVQYHPPCVVAAARRV